MKVNRLESYLAEAVRKDLCTRVFCTTCGATEFRTGAIKALANATGARVSEAMDEAQAFAIAHALRDVTPADPTDLRLVDAVRYLLVAFCGRIGEVDTAAVLGSCWSGSLLRRMHEHDKARQAAQRAQAAFEAGAEARRAEKKRLKQQEHEKRLALKKERDRLWRERNGKTE